jgi:hypothetical protein
MGRSPSNGAQFWPRIITSVNSPFRAKPSCVGPTLIPIKGKAASYGGNCVLAIGWDQCRDGYMAIRQHGQQLLIEPITKSLPDMSATVSVQSCVGTSLGE